MRYIDVNWRGARSDDPCRLVSELDAQRHEVRKLEFFQSGAVGSASSVHETSHTRLGSVEVPPLQEILADPQFTGREISVEEFESLWQQHGRCLMPYEVVQLVATGQGIPASLAGMSAAVLLSHSGTNPQAYEVEFVASDGTTIWTGTVPREFLRAQPAA